MWKSLSSYQKLAEVLQPPGIKSQEIQEFVLTTLVSGAQENCALPLLDFGGSTGSEFPWSIRTVSNSSSGAEYEPQQCSLSVGRCWCLLLLRAAGSLQRRRVPGLAADAAVVVLMALWGYGLDTDGEPEDLWFLIWFKWKTKGKKSNLLVKNSMPNIWVILGNVSNNCRAGGKSALLCSYWRSCWIPGSLHWLLPIYSTSVFIYHFDQKSNFGGHLLIPSLEKITSNSFLNKKGLQVTWITLALRDMSLTPLSCLKCSISSHSPNLKQK